MYAGTQVPGRVVWITGLSGAGKTTLADALTARLRTEGQTVVQLDGDVLREVLGSSGAAFDRRGRLELALLYARLCRLLALQGVTVVIATISLFREVHDWNRQHLPGYVEVLLDVPLDELHRRDAKGLYQKAAAGELAHMAGLDLQVDFPEQPDVHCRYCAGHGPEVALAEVLAYLHTPTARPE